MRRRVWLALVRARWGIAAMAAIYGVAIVAGMLMAHGGVDFALRRRDAIVRAAHRADPASRADDRGNHLAAAAIDFSRNLLAGAADTVGGLAFVVPIGLGAYRGWVGGLVSVDAHHRSRLIEPRSAAYYLITLLLQASAFVIAGGAGLHLGYANLRRRGPFIGPRWFRLPADATRDAAWLYAIIVPVFAAGSLFEFLCQV